MAATSCQSRKLARILVFFFTFLLIVALSLPWVSAEEEPKPKPQQWQINGIVAALDDGYDEVKQYAFRELRKYDIKKVKEPKDIIKKIGDILKDEEVDSCLRSSAAEALAKFGEPAVKYIPDIANILNNEKVHSYVRSSAAWALAKFGEPAVKYIPDILNILKNEKLNSYVR